jgi:hypothetical protein
MRCLIKTVLAKNNWSFVENGTAWSCLPRHSATISIQVLVYMLFYPFFKLHLSSSSTSGWEWRDSGNGSFYIKTISLENKFSTELSFHQETAKSSTEEPRKRNCKEPKRTKTIIHNLFLPRLSVVRTHSNILGVGLES